MTSETATCDDDDPILDMADYYAAEWATTPPAEHRRLERLSRTVRRLCPGLFGRSIPPVRRDAPRARARRSRPVRTGGSKVTAAPDGDGDPDGVSPELGRFLDWLADEAVREMVAQ